VNPVPISAAQLHDHLLCPHRVAMDAAADPALRDDGSPVLQLLWERRVAERREVVRGFGPCLDLSELGAAERERATREAIARGGAWPCG
jgi:hypothetical protein